MTVTYKHYDPSTGELTYEEQIEIPPLRDVEFRSIHDEICGCKGTLPFGNLKKWDLFWSPEGKKIDTVEALTSREAIRKVPQPYRKYLGEIYAVEVQK